MLVQNHSGELQEAIKNPRHTPINLTAVYFNLLSPDNIRHNGIMRSIGASDEKEWVKRIHKALKNLSGKEMTLKVFMDNGEQANVRINLMFICLSFHPINWLFSNNLIVI